MANTYNLKSLGFTAFTNDCNYVEICNYYFKTQKDLCNFIQNIWKLQRNGEKIAEYFGKPGYYVIFSNFIKRELTPENLVNPEIFCRTHDLPLVIVIVLYNNSKDIFVNIEHRIEKPDCKEWAIIEHKNHAPFCNGEANLLYVDYKNFSFDNLD